jgi:hypothetical protein
MAFAKFEKPITNDEGNLVANVTVTVRKETAGAPLAVLYSDALGTLPLTNPATFASGICKFYTAGSAGGLRLDAVATGFSQTWRNEACGTGAQVDASGEFTPGYMMEFEVATTAPPSAGGVRANNANLSAATQIFISETNGAGSNIEARLAALAAGDAIILTAADGTQVSWAVVTNTDSGGYRTIAVSDHAGETSMGASPASLQLQLAAGGTAASVSFSPTGGVAATTVQGAIEELDTEKLAKTRLGFVTPEDYGAVGDGVADDTAAVQAAFSSGSNVFLPGLYLLTDTIAVPNTGSRTYKGRGRTVRTFVANMNKPYLKLDNSSGSVYYVHFCDFSMDSTNVGTRTSEAGIQISGTVDTNWCVIKVSDVSFRGLYHGILVDKAGTAGGEGRVAKGEYYGIWSDAGSNGLQPAYVIRATTSINNGIVIQGGVYSFSEAGIAIGDGSIHTGDIVINGIQFFGDSTTPLNSCVRINGGSAYAYNISITACQFEGVVYSLDFTNVDGCIVRGCNWGGPSRLSLVTCENIQIDYSEVITPAQITSNQNNYDPSDGAVGWCNAGVLRLNSDASRTLTGLKSYGDNRLAIMVNVGAQDIVLSNENASSAAANRFSFGRDVTLQAGQMMHLYWDCITQRWRSADPAALALLQTGALTVNGNLIVNPSSSGSFTMQWIDDTAAAINAVFRKTRSAPAANDQIGTFSMQGRDSALNNTVFGTFGLLSNVVTDGAESGQWFWTTIAAGVSATRFKVGAGLMVGNGAADPGNTNINVEGAYYADGTKVVGNRVAGWAAASGTATRTTFATGSVTTAQLAERVKALIDDLVAHGLIGT